MCALGGVCSLVRAWEAAIGGRAGHCGGVGVVAASASTVAAQQGDGEGSGTYPDTAADSYYAEPVSQLTEQGVFAGTLCEDGFCPDEAIDRKTMAVWVVRVLDGEDPGQC